MVSVIVVDYLGVARFFWFDSIYMKSSFCCFSLRFSNSIMAFSYSSLRTINSKVSTSSRFLKRDLTADSLFWSLLRAFLYCSGSSSNFITPALSMIAYWRYYYFFFVRFLSLFEELLPSERSLEEEEFSWFIALARLGGLPRFAWVLILLQIIGRLKTYCCLSSRLLLVEASLELR